MSSGIDGLAFIRSERRNVDKRSDLRIGAGFGDDGATVGMTDQYDRALGPGDRKSRDSRVASKSRRWILRDAYVVTCFLEYVVNALPTGAVNETSMDEYNGFHRARAGGDARFRSRSTESACPWLVG